MKKKLLLLVAVIILVLTTFTGCNRNWRSLFWNTEGDRPDNSQKKGIPNNVVYNVITATKLAEVNQAKEDSALSDYVDIKKVIKRVGESVVHVTATTADGEISASGVVIGNSELREDELKLAPEGVTKKSYVAISHFVFDLSIKITVSDHLGNEYNAYLIGSDPDSDVCVLVVYAEIAPVEYYTDSDLLEAGENVLAVGYPLVSTVSTVTRGILSAPASEIDFGTEKATLLQTDATVNAGNTGGALFTDTGLFIGLVDTKYNGYLTDVEGINFAVPSNDVLNITRELISTGTSTSYGYIEGKYLLGCTFQDDYSNRWGTQSQVVVKALDPNGSFYKSNLQVNDYVKEVSYKGTSYTVDKTSKLIEYFNSIEFQVGDELTLYVSRNGTNVSVKVTIVQYIYGLN